MKDTQYISLAKEVSRWSKDPSRKIGAVFVNDDGVILSQGWNGFPRGFDDSKEIYEDRETKYKYIIHAEMNAIYNAARIGMSLNDSTLYCWGLPVCSECAKALAQVGVKRVVWDSDEAIPEKWVVSGYDAFRILSSLGIRMEKLNETIQHNR